MATRVTKTFMQKWFPTETYPIFGIVGLAVGGAGYYLWKLSQGPEVVWDRHGDWRPWDRVKQDQNLKFLSYNPDFWAARKKLATEKRVVDEI
ncbi:hypothetical protein EHS25_005947 [Saitozyma podzolica]|uniref:NADH dehydrogenase (Ubiquinone) 1 alpha subcomplex 4 n=1 Tax=Saitozyma podzolica TaxID=1890683 RepID=A0A427XTW3_9TREE|nr:hypothetical protein EHS25_005947 [Saitozyma podzolica]